MLLEIAEYLLLKVLSVIKVISNYASILLPSP